MAWRLDSAIHAAAWDRGEGAFRVGGRWNSKGRRAVYCSVDPSTAILEVAVHKGFRALDTTPHILTCLEIPDPTMAHIVRPSEIPDADWLAPGIPASGQQAFGDRLLADHALILIPSAVSPHSWNLIFDTANAADTYRLASQEAFVLDSRLHPAS